MSPIAFVCAQLYCCVSHHHPFVFPVASHNVRGHSTYISSVATAEEVEAALEGLEPTGDLTVTRSVNTNGYDWQVKRKLYVRVVWS